MAEMPLSTGGTVWVPELGWLPKVVAVDEDGTFLSTSDGYDVERFEALWPHLQSAGCHFVVASGNQIWQMRDLFDRHADEIAYVSANGSLVEDEGATPVFAASAHPSAISAVIAEIHHVGRLPFLMSGMKGAYVERGAPASFVEELSRYFHRIEVVDDFSCVDDQVFMFSTVTDDELCRSWMSHFEEACAGALIPVYSGDGYFDLVLPGVNKATGLAHLCDRWGIAAQDVAAFGDSENDLEMLSWAGAGYAMANASDRVKAAAPGVAPANTEEGVLQVLEAWFMARDHDA